MKIIFQFIISLLIIPSLFAQKVEPSGVSLTDMSLTGMNEWIKMKIVVKGDHAQLYINDSKQPCLVINDLKYGAVMSGSLGLWVGNWTEGYFSDLKISK